MRRAVGSRVWFVILAAGALMGTDWPGRERELLEAARRAPAAQRAELLQRVAATPGPSAETSVVNALHDPEPGVRLAAANLVARYRFASARDVLVGWLTDPRAEARERAARALGALREPQTVPALARVVGDADVRVRLAAVEALRETGGAEATVALLNRLQDAEGGVRVAAARALGELGDTRAVLSLLGSLQDPLPEVRDATATALGRLHDARAVRALLALLRDSQADVRLSAVRALGTLGATEAVVDLAPFALREERIGDVQGRTQLARAAVESIGHIGGSEARDVLVRVVRRSETDGDLGRAAAEALRGLGLDARASVGALVAQPLASAVVPLLIELLGDLGGEESAGVLASWYDGPEGARYPEAILRALGRTGTPLALRTLLRAASPPSSTESTRVGSTASRRSDPRQRGALTGLRAFAERRGSVDPEALDPLSDVLRTTLRAGDGESTADLVSAVADLIGYTRNARAPRVLGPLLAAEQATVRTSAAEALARVGVDGVESEVAGALADRVPEVRLAAAEALGRHGGERALTALIQRWSGSVPIDRAHAARAIGRIGARTHDRRATELLARAATATGAALESALLDALGYPAAAGDREAAEILIEHAGRGYSDVVALEALSNAASTGPPSIRVRLMAAARSASSTTAAARATAVWGLQRLGGSAQPALLAALGDGDHTVVANAAGALARLYSSGVAAAADAQERLCHTLPRRRQVAVRANVLLALARGRLRCGVDLPRRMLVDGRSDLVRRAALELLRPEASGETPTARAARGAIEQCAAGERDADLAAVCRRVLDGHGASTPERPRAVAGESIDALVIRDDEETVDAGAPCLLVMPDAITRYAVTGPAGWIHERPAPTGVFRVVDPETSPLEP